MAWITTGSWLQPWINTIKFKVSESVEREMFPRTRAEKFSSGQSFKHTENPIKSFNLILNYNISITAFDIIIREVYLCRSTTLAM